jgi:hypothetical protein
MQDRDAAIRLGTAWARLAGALLTLAAALGGCAGGDDGAAFVVAPAGGGGAGGSVLPFDLDAAQNSDAPAPHVIDGMSLGCPCKLTMNFTTLATGQQGALTMNGATLRVTDGSVDAAADFPFTVASDNAVSGLSVIALDDPTRTAVVVPPSGHYCVAIEYIPRTASVPTMRVAYGGTFEAVAGPPGGTAQIALTPTPGFVNMVVLRLTPAINSVRITPGAGGGIGVPAICFGTDPPPP